MQLARPPIVPRAEEAVPEPAVDRTRIVGMHLTYFLRQRQRLALVRHHAQPVARGGKLTLDVGVFDVGVFGDTSSEVVT